MAEKMVDVAIVGAGISGLTAARRAAEQGASVIVLEARDRVGGRLMALDAPGGRAFDGGGEYIGPPQDRVMALVEELGLRFEGFAGGGDFSRLRGEQRMRTDDVPCEKRADREAFTAAFAQLESLAQGLPDDAPWSHPRALEWDSQTFRTWALANIPNPVAREAVEAQLMPAGGAEEVSFLQTIEFLRGHGSLEAMASCEEYRVAGGTFLLPVRCAEQLGEAVVLGSPVRSVEHSESGVLVHADGLDVRADAAIIALAPPLVERIEFWPDLPPRRRLLQQHWAQQPSIKSVAVYESRWWAERGFSGWGLADRDVAAFVRDASPEDESVAVLESFTNATARLPAWAAEDAGRRRAAWLETVDALFGPGAPEPLAYMEGNWLEDRWSTGCGQMLQCGVLTGLGDALREPVGRISWAGTEVATEWPTYIDGAVRAGEEAAARAAAASS